ncbi:MAG TPA: hypothetical protein VFZ58_03795 [Candidatus Saccharimonadales bacterium]
MFNKKSGFTVIELMLAMAFLAFVLLFVVTALLQMMRTYNKGLIYKEINQAGRTISEELVRNLRTAKPGSVNIQQQTKGRLCIGGQTYAWNTGSSDQNKYTDNTPVAGIIRVTDTGGSLCTETSGVLADIPRTETTDLAGGAVQMQRFSLQQADGGNISIITMFLSTTGENAPTIEAGEIICPAGSAGEFCAVADLSTTVTTRNRGN